ncbi:hypothetical protein [Winogradskyella sediminis]|uniref:Uncharacterized protein n=1 Tax=Winogradskyella sediminis TaxID=1382466 RepID=A0A1H1UH10_9FLAO|nr:hypothetical protein [Winogradskyella sediminis]REG85212.1 hypothetical protein C8N41_10472 [Winogradskyella sediminis]SDS71670.1 hypothetical protein SAMN04489797_2246 [Winogradskyella sediminis]
MKIINTFVIVKESLFSVQYETENLNEFAKCFELWNDPVYLREFFEKNKEDLDNEFWKGITIEEAIIKTREDASLFEEELLYIAETGKTERLETLSTLFEPLSKGIIEENFEKDKAKGLKRRSWLRIYAIRIEANLFVICGGAIKLTATMNEKPHLLLELEKLEFTRNYLQNGEDENLDFVELK